MIKRIKSVTPLDGYKILVAFDEGRKVVYDVGDDIRRLTAFSDLRLIPGLFNSVQLDTSRTIVFWNDQIDLPSDTIYEYGNGVGSVDR